MARITGPITAPTNMTATIRLCNIKGDLGESHAVFSYSFAARAPYAHCTYENDPITGKLHPATEISAAPADQWTPNPGTPRLASETWFLSPPRRPDASSMRGFMRTGGT